MTKAEKLERSKANQERIARKKAARNGLSRRQAQEQGVVKQATVAAPTLPERIAGRIKAIQSLKRAGYVVRI